MEEIDFNIEAIIDHNLWLNKNGGKRLHLTGFYSHIAFDGQNISHAKFEGTYYKCTFMDTNLFGVDASDAEFVECDFDGAHYLDKMKIGVIDNDARPLLCPFCENELEMEKDPWPDDPEYWYKCDVCCFESGMSKSLYVLRSVLRNLCKPQAFKDCFRDR